MRLITKIILLITINFSINLYSKEKDNSIIGCTPHLPNRCLCKANIINCGGADVYLLKDTPLEYIKFKIVSKEGQISEKTLKNPPKSFFESLYYLSQDTDTDTARQLGLRYGDKISFAENAFGIKKSTMVYESNLARKIVGPIEDSTFDDRKTCRYLSKPILLSKTSKCSTVKMCLGTVSCNYDLIREETAFCLSKDGQSCPSAKECVIDDTIVPSYPSKINTRSSESLSQETQSI